MKGLVSLFVSLAKRLDRFGIEHGLFEQFDNGSHRNGVTAPYPRNPAPDQGN